MDSLRGPTRLTRCPSVRLSIPWPKTRLVGGFPDIDGAVPAKIDAETWDSEAELGSGVLGGVF